MKLVIISDTHGLHGQIRLPPGDVLIHCGDFLHGELAGQGVELTNFNAWLKKQKFRHKIVVAGNHDKVLGIPAHAETWRPKLTNCIYLQDSGTEISGIKFWGSPYSPDFFPDHWVFNQPRGSESTRARWRAIPDDTHVLITHGPPHGILDTCRDMNPPYGPVHVGCEDLRARVDQLKNLHVHAFGHIHESHGMYAAAYGVTFAMLHPSPAATSCGNADTSRSSCPTTRWR